MKHCTKGFPALTLCLIMLLAVSCNPTPTSRKVINLGETPWHFNRLEKKERTNLANTNTFRMEKNGSEMYFTPDSITNMMAFKLIFPQPDINRVLYTISGLTIDNVWETIVIRHGHGIDLKYETVADVAEAGETVGLVNKKKYGYSLENISGHYTTIKVTIDKISAIGGKELQPQNNTLEVYDLTTTKEVKREALVDFDDSDWEKVGIPHCYNDNDTYLNASTMQMWRGEVWYRKKWEMPKEYKDKKVILEFQGVNIGVAIYVNGVFQPGITDVAQPDEVTHVGGFLPFAVDITKSLKPGESNTIAVRVSNEFDGFYTNPGFGNYEGFGMGWGGIVSPVFLHITSPVHIPLNVYAPQRKWGTYIATISATPGEAIVKLMTNVENNTSTDKHISLKTLFVDMEGKTVLTLENDKTIPANQAVIFETNATIENPVLWYPNGSKRGTPYLYTVKHQVWDGKKMVDEFQEKHGIRTITWDDDYCYVNGEKTILKGFGHRNIYPALGSAIPAELQWKDIALIAKAGGNTLRVGHVPATKTMVEACDAYGILVMQNSGDNEWVLKNEPALTYKREYDHEMIVAFRNHPSIAVWESNNGLPLDGGDIYHALNTYQLVMKWDSLQPRIVHNRDGYPQNWPDSINVMVGYTNHYQKQEGSPTLNTEVYGAYWDGRRSWNMARFDYENEIAFTEYYVNNYISDLDQKACGWIDWMLAETQGEGYTIYLNGLKNQKSLGSSGMDGNRFPKLKYRVYQNALWVDYETRPGVALQSSWDMQEKQPVVAYSNCPSVELFLNGNSLGTKTPHSESRKCVWNDVEWQKGTLVAIGLDENGTEVCHDTRTSSGEPYQLELTMEPNLIRPDGATFLTWANGSDVAIATVRVLDIEGNLCTTASNDLHFVISGNAHYRGSYNFYVQENAGPHDFAPGAKTLKAEGGLMRVAIKSGFEPGDVSVKVTSDGLKPGSALFAIAPL